MVSGTALFDLSGYVAVVTGASRGIGNAIASGLAQAGARVFGLSRSVSINNSENFFYKTCDVTRVEVFKSRLDHIFKNEGRIDILVNAAGITLPAKMNESPIVSFRETIQTNLISVYECCQAVQPFMHKGARGSIVNVSSIGASLGFPGNPAYIASKGGVSALTRALAIDYGVFGIRVNNLVPGYVRTSMTEASYRSRTLRLDRERRTILGRYAEADEMVGAVIFLASEASSYVTGIDLVVDGGWIAKGL